jgi:hypothetical protein
MSRLAFQHYERLFHEHYQQDALVLSKMHQDEILANRGEVKDARWLVEQPSGEVRPPG